MADLVHVTQVLAPWQDFSRVAPITLELAAARGTRVHRACAAHARGLFAPPLLVEEAGYLESFKRWFGLAVEEVLVCEQTLEDQSLGITGRPDLIVQFVGDNSLALVDLKTPKAKSKSWRLQLAAYWHLAELNGFTPITRCLSLRLRANGAAPICDEYKISGEDLNAFMAALKVYRFFHS